MVDAVKTPFPVGELVDIEPLTAPGMDWIFWLETALWVLAGLFILVFLLYVMRFLYRPFLFKRQLVLLQKDASGHQEPISKTEIAKLYYWLSDYQTWLHASRNSERQAAIFKEALTDLSDRINESCFSDQAVSRETYVDLISTAQSIVQQNVQFSMSLVPLEAFKFVFRHVKNRVASWKR